MSHHLLNCCRTNCPGTSELPQELRLHKCLPIDHGANTSGESNHDLHSNDPFDEAARMAIHTMSTPTTRRERTHHNEDDCSIAILYIPAGSPQNAMRSAHSPARPTQPRLTKNARNMAQQQLLGGLSRDLLYARKVSTPERFRTTVPNSRNPKMKYSYYSSEKICYYHKEKLKSPITSERNGRF